MNLVMRHLNLPANGSRPVTNQLSHSTATSTTTSAPGGCTSTAKVTSSWTGGYQLEVAVKNTGSTALSGWTTTFTLPGSQQVTNSWNAVVSQSGQQITAANQSYNGTLAPGTSTTWKI